MKKIFLVIIFLVIATTVFAQRNALNGREYVIERETDTSVRITKTTSVDVVNIKTIAELRAAIRDYQRTKIQIQTETNKRIQELDTLIAETQTLIAEAIRLGVTE